MPKMKTNQAAAKRFKKTASGKIKRTQSLTRHLKTAMSPSRKRKLRKQTVLDKADFKRVMEMLPYSR